MDPMELIELLEGHKSYIQTHNCPDPDAVASAFGLQYFLKQHGVDAKICYDGTVEALSTKKMFEVFGIEILQADTIQDMTEEDYIVAVDSQKYNANMTDLIGDEVGCIDHHPTFISCIYKYKDIRLAGACSTLIADYFYRTHTQISPAAAAALAYGIKIDTNDFIRGVTDLDIDMFAYVYKQADVDKIETMYNNVMQLSDLKAYGAAIDNIHINEGVGFACLPMDCPDAQIAIISDFILSLDVVDISIIYAVRRDGIKFSVRSERKGINAGKLIAAVLKEYGSGGGHYAMAGGFIPRENIDKMPGLQGPVENEFMKQINRMKRGSI
ncbi:MAG: DHH family phosphoesterase [Eubacterium sp.]|nr:DHH family phosphoesterase [Eubacterium sp.]MCI8919562.1 DHH family phosphoesterase [Eubacterium sp.]